MDTQKTPSGNMTRVQNSHFLIADKYFYEVSVKPVHCEITWMKIHLIKPLSQLAHEHLTTLCDRNFLASHELSHTWHDVSHSLRAF